MSDDKTIIDAIIKAEVDPNDPSKVTNDPADAGGRTQWGISERANPEAWADGQVTEQEARDIYERKYVRSPGFSNIHDFKLKHLLVDFGVNSGPTIAVKALQDAVGATPDGILGPDTLAKLDALDAKLVTNRVVDARLRLIGRIVSKDWKQAKFCGGWIGRALDFRVE